MQTDNLNKYIFISLMIHSLFLLSFNSVYTQKDISQIGEQGMQIQMVLMQDQIDESYDNGLASDERKVLKKDKNNSKQYLITVFKVTKRIRYINPITVL